MGDRSVDGKRKLRIQYTCYSIVNKRQKLLKNCHQVVYRTVSKAK